MIQPRPEHAFQRRVDLGEQTPDPVGDLDDLTGEVVVEPAEHAQLRDLLVGDLDRPERVRHGAGRFGDDRRVSRVGLRLTGMQIRDAPHRQPRQVTNESTCGLRDRDRECTDRRGLIYDQQHHAMRGELVDHRPQLALVVRECSVE